jgi:hypothetical protein
MIVGIYKTLISIDEIVKLTYNHRYNITIYFIYNNRLRKQNN